MDDYLINGETLENIADKIREKAPDAYEGNTVTPEEMPDAVDEVWQAGYNEGSKSVDLSSYQTKHDETLETESKEIVGAINEVNETANNAKNTLQQIIDGDVYVDSALYADKLAYEEVTLKTKNKTTLGAINELYEKIGEGVDTSNLATIDKIDSIALTNYDAQSISTTNGLVWRDDSTFTIGEDDYDNIPTTHRVPIVAGENVTFEVDEENQVVKINAKGGEADTSNLATVDKVKSIDTWAGGVSELYTDDGISWREGYAFNNAPELAGDDISNGDIFHRIPIVAGDGIEFENDGQLITINATGGGSSENSVLSVTVETDYPTTMSAIIEAIQSAGGDLSKLTFVTLTGYTTCNLMMSFQWRGGNYYRAECIDLGTMEKIYNPATDNSIYDVTSKRIEDFLQEGTQYEAEKVEMPQIRFTSANGYAPEGVTTFYVDEENPLKLTVEIVGGGALKVGDQLQVCRRKRFDGSMGNDFKRKYKLHRFKEYVVTEEDLNKRFLTVSIYLTDKTKHGLFRDGQEPTISPLYLRIRRAKGIMQNNDTGQTVDAEFSNIVTIWKSYHRSSQLIRIY